MIERPTHPGIYGIVHDESGRLYIGSAKNVAIRWRCHLSSLRHGIHSSPHFQNAWNKYGEDAFRFVVLEACLPDDVMLRSREQHWLDRYAEKLFNASRFADAAYRGSPSPGRREARRRKTAGRESPCRNPSKKLSPRAAIEVMHRYAAGERTATLAVEYGVSQRIITSVVKRTVYGDLPVHPRVDEVCRERVKNWNRMPPITVAIEIPAVIDPPPKPIPPPSTPKKRVWVSTNPRPAKVALSCGICGKEMLVSPCFADERKTCSKECQKVWRSRKLKAMWEDPAIRGSITESLRGRKPSEETNAKRAESIRRFHAERKARDQSSPD